MLAALGHFCEFHGPALVMITQEVPGPQSSRLLAAAGSREGEEAPECAGCRGDTTAPRHLLLSRAPGPAARTWVSSQAPLAPELGPVVRHAVLRAISCEVLPAREGAVLFSSPASSAVLSHAFSLRDLRARGARRQYALLLLARDRRLLASHSAVLTAQLAAIVAGLQAKADAVSEQDCQTVLEQRKCSPTREHTARTQRRASLKPTRGLAEVTQDPLIFQTLHRDLVLVLSLAERCLREEVLSGQPLRSSVRGPGLAPLSVVRAIRDQVPGGPGQAVTWHQVDPAKWRALLYRVLSGRTVQVRSCERALARAACEGLCILLPHNLAASPACFANLVLAGPDLEDEPGPKLCVGPGPAYTFHCDHLATDCEACGPDLSSAIVTRFCRAVAAGPVPPDIQEMWLRTEVERALLQARVFIQLKESGDQKAFLARSGLQPADHAILAFFGMFS